MSDQPPFSDSAYIEEMRQHAKHILERFGGLSPVVEALNKPDDAPTNIVQCACVHPDRSMCIAIRTDRSYEEVMGVYDECACGCHDEDEESEEMGE